MPTAYIDRWILVDPERRAQPRRKADRTLLEQLYRTRRTAILAILVTVLAIPVAFGAGFYVAAVYGQQIQKANSYNAGEQR